MAGKASTEAEIKRHRKLADWAGGLATPKGDVERKRFRLGKIRCEEFRPYFAHNPGYVLLYCHGGGYVSGGLGYAGNLSTKLATATGFTVYSFAYRLAPEHPYPAAAEDADIVWDYLTENVVSADHVILAGDSAGGNMALCLTQRLIAQGKPVPRLLLLFSPWTDMTGTAESYETNRDIDPILSKEFVMNSAKAYMGDGDPADAAYSPLFGSFENFPPVYIMAGRNGILLDDSIRLKERIDQAGGTAELDIEAKGWHVYQQMPGTMAREAMKRLAAQVSFEIYGKC
ncbi:MAG: alpha/beta hydrolase [Lachnospiraceae bacterium]|nr:alpha/beta hydrolase [Lachnospiraceae bacterium]